jgi:hypothetical protein
VLIIDFEAQAEKLSFYLDEAEETLARAAMEAMAAQQSRDKRSSLAA